MTASFHQQHGELLTNLSDPDVMSGVLDRIGLRNAWWDHGRPWSRSWAKIMDPETGRVQLAFETRDEPHEICIIDRSPAGAYCDGAIGSISARRFPDDPKLLGLATVLAKHPEARVVRYRLAKRCTLYDGDPEPSYLKVFPDSRGDRLNSEAAQLWEAAREDRLDFDVARPLGFDVSTNTFAQAAVAGEPVADILFSADGPALAARLGAAAGSIPDSGLEPEQRLDAHAELGRAEKRATAIAVLVPELRGELDRLVGALQRVHDGLNPKLLRPIHGSPHTNQWLIDGDRLALVDFDRFSMGDPELDVATFAGEIDFETEALIGQVNGSFIEAYSERCGDLDPVRLSLYRAHKRLAKAYRTAASIRVDGDKRTAAHLDRAFVALGSGDES